MYIKECALGHSPGPIVDVGNGLYECPGCQAQYSTDGKSWHLRSPSLILLEDERFKLFIEERREDVQKKLSVQANRSIAEASKRIAVGIMQTGNEIGIQINNAATIDLTPFLVPPAS
jgi:hypothetical protein